MNKKHLINPILHWWFTPMFPTKHMENILKYRPEGFSKQLRNFYRTWILHPIKRRVAKYYLIVLRKFFGLEVVGITGSAGKTTTKELLGSILSQKSKTVFSFANIDPVYNIPTTIFKCRPDTKYLVLEMGVEFPGEMKFYTWLAKPDVGIITNIYPTHTEFFGDEEGVFTEKSQLVKSLSEKDTAVLNWENRYLKRLKGKLKSKTVWFGEDAEISSRLETFTKDFTTQFELIFDKQSKEKTIINLPVLGFQYIYNSLAASSAAKVLGFDLEKVKNGLENFTPPEHRMTVIKLENGAIVIDDTYNSNPEAAKKSLFTLKKMPVKGKDKIVIFGDMKELGKWEEKLHKELGAYISKVIKPEYLICVGSASLYTASEASKLMGRKRVVHCRNVEDCFYEIKSVINERSLIFIKGSRSVGLDKVVERLQAS